MFSSERKKNPLQIIKFLIYIYQKTTAEKTFAKKFSSEYFTAEDGRKVRMKRRWDLFEINFFGRILINFGKSV